jgi:putative PIN family toxin of toxin-antitoxin system
MRVTFDANVLISAFITTEGIASRVLLRSVEQHEVCLSDYILREFRENLILKLQYPSGLVDIFLKFLVSRSQLFSPRVAAVAPDFSDPKDIPILQLLEVAGVHYFVTGDKKILALKKHKQTLILSLREALELL